MPLVEALRGFRRWIGLLAMVNDDNNGSVRVDENGAESFEASFNDAERARIDGALDFTRKVLERRPAPRASAGRG